MLQKMLDEKSSDVNKLLNSRLLNSLDLPSDEVAGCQFQDLVDFKVTKTLCLNLGLS